MKEELQQHLDDLKLKLEGRSINIDDVNEIVSSLMATLTRQATDAEREMYDQLDQLSAYIQHAKQEIATLRPDDIRAEYIPNATDELDAIVEATAGATNEILDAMEVLEEMTGDVPPETAAKLTDVTTRVYEACSFQDITGQRTTKVINALKHIEEKIEALVNAFGEEIARTTGERPAPRNHQGDHKDGGEALTGRAAEEAEGLLNGPQKQGGGVSQADIDALFS